MGLDIYAYGNVTYKLPLECPTCGSTDYEPDGDVTSLRHSGWPERADGLAEGFYACERKEHFRAGSYSGYSAWREWLSELAFGVSPQAVWSDEAAYRGRPFFELVCFSDCEGTIGPATCAKLAADFVEWRDRAQSSLPAGREYYLETYERFAAAFKHAAGAGAVVFA